MLIAISTSKGSPHPAFGHLLPKEKGRIPLPKEKERLPLRLESKLSLQCKVIENLAIDVLEIQEVTFIIIRIVSSIGTGKQIP
ncbi:MAG: hypothetical protein CMN21_14305 [Rubinisphaera sp.]|nr:hypothetical protein [Rubinisphaera sp.]